MSLQDEIERDLDNVFFTDFARSCLLIRIKTGDEEGIRCMINTGVERMTSDGYVKAKWEVMAKASIGLCQGDIILELDDVGMPRAKYEIGTPLERQIDITIYEAEKKKL